MKQFTPNTMTTVQATNMFKSAIKEATGEDMSITVAVKAETRRTTTYTVRGLSLDPIARFKAIAALKKVAASLPLTNIDWR